MFHLFPKLLVSRKAHALESRWSMSSLREFWFPFLLFLAGIPSALIGLYMTGNGRRVCFTLSALFVFLAVLAYIWGDPVRGPLANLIHPDDASEFTLQAGVGCIYPVSKLKDGIDFSHCVHWGTGTQPIELWVRKTWWSGLEVRATINGPDGKPQIVFDDRKLEYNPGSFDVNYDDFAFEVVDARRSPMFQLVIAKDYRAVHMNARLFRSDGRELMVMKDTAMNMVPIQQANQPQYKLDRIFRYPSYVYQGERE